MISQIASDDVLDTAYDWLCRRRHNYPSDADVWDLRFRWREAKKTVQADLLNGVYRFSPLNRVTNRDGESLTLWSAKDALVLKAITIVLERHLPLSKNCTHVRGHGGGKAAVRRVYEALPANTFVLRTDVKSYYASIDHFVLLDRLQSYIPDRSLLNLLWQYMHRTVTWGGNFTDVEQGISRGCPLSPLIGAFFLHELDLAMSRLGLFYVRFMDDILVLAPSRWKLRRSVKMLNKVLSSLKLEKHPKKTFIGRIKKGFDFLGYHFGTDGLRIAATSLQHFVDHVIRLYEQNPGESFDKSRVGLYVKRWLRWSRAGLGCLVKLEIPACLGLFPMSPVADTGHEQPLDHQKKTRRGKPQRVLSGRRLRNLCCFFSLPPYESHQAEG